MAEVAINHSVRTGGASKAGVQSRRMSDVKALLSTLLYMAPALTIFVLFSYVPFFRSLWLSLNITDATGAVSKFNGLAYYARILNLDGSGRPELIEAMLTTFKFALMVVIPGIITGTLFAVLAASKVRGIKGFRFIYSVGIGISLASAAVIWSVLYNPSLGITRVISDTLGLQNPGVLNNVATALPAVALMTIWSGLGFNFLIALAGIQGIPQDVYESGMIDGTTPWTALRHITLPLLAPTLLFLLVINTIGAFQAFTQFNVLMGGTAGPQGSTNTFVFATFKSFWLDNRYGFASAQSMVLFVVLFVLSLIQFRGFDRKVHYQ